MGLVGLVGLVGVGEGEVDGEHWGGTDTYAVPHDFLERVQLARRPGFTTEILHLHQMQEEIMA